MPCVVCCPCPGRPAQTIGETLRLAGFTVAEPGDPLYERQQEAMPRRGTDSDGLLFMKGPNLEQHPFCRCGHDADLLCDQPIGDGKTCDLPLCYCCAREVGADYHLCPVHATTWTGRTAVEQLVNWGPRAVSEGT